MQELCTHLWRVKGSSSLRPSCSSLVRLSRLQLLGSEGGCGETPAGDPPAAPAPPAAAADTSPWGAGGAPPPVSGMPIASPPRARLLFGSSLAAPAAAAPPLAESAAAGGAGESSGSGLFWPSPASPGRPKKKKQASGVGLPLQRLSCLQLQLC